MEADRSAPFRGKWFSRKLRSTSMIVSTSVDDMLRALVAFVDVLVPDKAAKTNSTHNLGWHSCQWYIICSFSHTHMYNVYIPAPDSTSNRSPKWRLLQTEKSQVVTWQRGCWLIYNGIPIEPIGLDRNKFCLEKTGLRYVVDGQGSTRF